MLLSYTFGWKTKSSPITKIRIAPEAKPRVSRSAVKKAMTLKGSRIPIFLSQNTKKFSFPLLTQSRWRRRK